MGNKKEKKSKRTGLLAMPLLKYWKSCHLRVMLDPEGIKTSFSLTTLQPSLFQKNTSCKCGFPFGTDFIISIFSCMLSSSVHFWKRGAPLYQELNVQKIYIIKLGKIYGLGSIWVWSVDFFNKIDKFKLYNAQA